MIIYGILERYDAPYTDEQLYVHSIMYRDEKDAKKELERLNSNKSKFTEYEIEEYELE